MLSGNLTVSNCKPLAALHWSPSIKTNPFSRSVSDLNAKERVPLGSGDDEICHGFAEVADAKPLGG
jgi:hypothetical protein